MTKQNNKPQATLRDGALKATIWKNQAENGTFYSVDLSRTYQDEQGDYHDSHSFSGSELLRIAHLASKAYDQITDLRSADKEPADEEADA